MVHALRETHRVLAPGGWMADVRPRSRDVRVELVGAGRTAYVGEIDESEFAELDVEADRRMAEAVRRRWFRAEGQIEFGFHWFFDSLDDFVEYVTEQWEDPLDDATLTRTAEMLSASPPGTRIRVHKPLHLAWYSNLK